MPFDMSQLKGLPSPYYRVAIKVIIFDELGRLLVVQNKNGKWELPGGGWEHDETIEQTVRRELAEELHAEVTNISDIEFVLRGYSQMYDLHAIRLAVRAVLVSPELTPHDTIIKYDFVNRHDFLQLELVGSDKEFQKETDQIWSE